MPMELVEFKKNLNTLVDRGELALPSNVPAESFRNAAIIAYQDNPQVGKCTPDSIFRAIRKIAGMGLVPDGAEAALVPYKHERNGQVSYICQAIPMVAGLIKRARNSAEIRTLWAELVYEGEELTVWVENGERKWDHTFDPLKRKGKIRGVYAVAKLKDGTVEFEPLPIEEVEKIRGVSRAKDGPAWKGWYTEMVKKTAIRRLIKRLPVAADDRRRILESDSDTIGDMKDVTPKRTLQDRVDEMRQKEPEQPAAEPVEGEGGQPPSDTQSRSAPSPDDVEDAETVDAEPEQADPRYNNDRESGHTAEANEAFKPNPEQGFPMDDEFSEGWKAHEAGDAYEANPYVTVDQQKCNSWAGGWMGSQKQKDDKPKRGSKS